MSEDGARRGRFSGFSHLACRFIVQAGAQFRVRIRRRALQNSDGALRLLVAPVEVHGGAYYTQKFRILMVNSVNDGLRGSEVFAAFIKAGQRITQLQFVYRIAGEYGFTLQNAAVNRIQPSLLGQGANLLQRVGRIYLLNY